MPLQTRHHTIDNHFYYSAQTVSGNGTKPQKQVITLFRQIFRMEEDMMRWSKLSFEIYDEMRHSLVPDIGSLYLFTKRSEPWEKNYFKPTP